MKKKTLIIITTLVLIILAAIAFFTLSAKNIQQNFEKNLAAQHTVITEIQKDINAGWDTKDSSFVSEKLTDKQVKKIKDGLAATDTALNELKPAKDQTENRKKYQAVTKDYDSVKESFTPLENSYTLTTELNEAFNDKAIAGSTVNKDAKVKEDADFGKISKTIENKQIAPEKLITAIQELVTSGTEQNKERGELKKQIETIAADDQLKADITREQLQAFTDFIGKLKFVYLKDTYKAIIDAVPAKLEELTPKLSKLDATQRDRMLLALWEKEAGTSTPTATADMGEFEGSYIGSITAYRPQGSGIGPKNIGTFTFKDNGDFTEDNSGRTGNIFQEVDEARLNDTRQDPRQIIVPSLSYEAFKAAIKAEYAKAATTDKERSWMYVKDGSHYDKSLPAQSDEYYIATVGMDQSDARMVKRFNRKTGEVDDQAPLFQVRNVPEWEYDMRYTTVVWAAAYNN